MNKVGGYADRTDKTINLLDMKLYTASASSDGFNKQVIMALLVEGTGCNGGGGQWKAGHEHLKYVQSSRYMLACGHTKASRFFLSFA